MADKIYRDQYKTRAEYNAALKASGQAKTNQVTYKPTATEADKAEAQQAVQRGILTQSDYNKMYVAPTNYAPTTVEPAKVATDETGQPVESQFNAELQRLSGVLGDVQNFAGSLSETFAQQSEIYKKSFSDLQASLGEQSKLMQDQLEAYQKQTGSMVDITQSGFQQELKQAMGSGQDITPIFEKYSVNPKTPWATQSELQSLQAQAQQAIAGGLSEEQAQEAMDAVNNGTFSPEEAAKYFGKFSQEKAPEDYQKETVETVPIVQNTGIPEETEVISNADQVGAALDNVLEIGGPDLWNQLGSMDFENMSAADNLKIMLMAQLQTISDPTTNEYLNRMAETAKDSYNSALTLAQNSITEIDKAVEGENFVPTTYAGLAAKIQEQTKSLGMESVEAEKTYRQEQYDNWLEQEQDKRGRLEGYLKAKMYASGAQDSIQGLTAMALTVNAADLRLQSAQSEHNYAMSQLNIQSRQILTTYANNMTQLALDVETSKQTAASTYNDKLMEIEGLVIEDEQEKKKLALTALSTFQDKLYQLQKDQKDQEWKQYIQSYNETQDAVNNAYKLSGLTGTIHYLDSNGNTIDSGIATFDAKQYEENKLLQWAQYQHNIENDAWNKLWKVYESKVETQGANSFDAIFNGMAEATLGAPSGQFSGLSLGDLESAILNWNGAATVGAGLTTAKAQYSASSGEPSPIATCFEDGSNGGQCGDFMHKIFDLGYSMGDSLQSKVQKLNNVPNGYMPQVGDMVITNEHPTYGHVAVINAIDKDGNMTLTESNYYQKSMGPEKVSNSRKLNVNSNSIMGYHHGDLKPGIQEVIDIYNGASKGGIVGAITSGIKLVGDFIKSKTSTTTNPYIEKTIGYQETQNYLASKTFPPEAVEMFKLYEQGDSNAVKTFVSDPRWLTQYSEYKGSQSAQVNESQKQADIINYPEATATEKARIMNRATAGGYENEVNSYALGDYSSILGDNAKYAEAAKRIYRSIKGTDFKQADIANMVKKIQAGDLNSAKGELMSLYETSLGAEEKKTFKMQVRMVEDMVELQQITKDIADKTGFVAGNLEELAQVLGRTSDKELASYKARVQRLVQAYTKGQSGAAFSAQEFKNYAELFGNIKNTGDLNSIKIREFHDALMRDIGSNLATKTGYSIESLRDIVPSNKINSYYFAPSSLLTNQIKLNWRALGKDVDVEQALKDGNSIEDIYDAFLQDLIPYYK